MSKTTRHRRLAGNAIGHEYVENATFSGRTHTEPSTLWANRVRRDNYIFFVANFLTVCACQKVWKLVSSRQSYCKNKRGALLGPIQYIWTFWSFCKVRK